jgi:glutamate-1-semialdehyde aminotransferase
MSDQHDLVQRAAHVLPGGVLGSHRSGTGLEFVVREARGAYLRDASGRRYLDYRSAPDPCCSVTPIPPWWPLSSGSSPATPRTCS